MPQVQRSVWAWSRPSHSTATTICQHPAPTLNSQHLCSMHHKSTRHAKLPTCHRPSCAVHSTLTALLRILFHQQLTNCAGGSTLSKQPSQQCSAKSLMHFLTTSQTKTLCKVTTSQSGFAPMQSPATNAQRAASAAARAASAAAHELGDYTPAALSSYQML